jgi:hypothetical protein
MTSIDGNFSIVPVRPMLQKKSASPLTALSLAIFFVDAQKTMPAIPEFPVLVTLHPGKVVDWIVVSDAFIP